MKIAVVGAAGQLAADVIDQLNSDEVVLLTRAQLDIGDAEEIERRLKQIAPQAVINCAAYNLVDQAESEPETAFAVNAFGPRNLARVCEKLSCRLVHFSTDYVFGLETDRREPWRETDVPGPTSVYGASKLAGEHFVRAECRSHLVLRTCGLYGKRGARGKGGNFVETMLKVAASGKPLRVVADQFCTPSYTFDVAKAAIDLLRSDAVGLFHVTNAGACSWHELATEIFRASGLAVDCHPISTADWKCAARRPAYSVLSNGKLATAGIVPPADWRDALGRYLATRQR